MKSCRLHYLLVITLLFICSHVKAQRFWVSTGASNWNNTANWSTTSGGSGGASVPGLADVVTFNALGLGNCTLDVSPTVAGITVNGYTATIDVNGFNLTTTGTNVFNSGTINNTGAAAAVTLNTIASTTFNGTTFGAAVTGTSGRLFFNGSTFNGVVNVAKTDGSNDFSAGNNIFNNTATFAHNGSGYLVFGNVNRDQFNGVTTFNNNGSNRIYFAHNHTGQTTTFATDVILNTNKSGGIDDWSFLIADGVNTHVSFGGDLTINCGGTLRSHHRFVNGDGATVTYQGTVTVNITNSEANTQVQLGTQGISTYNGNIVLSNNGGAYGVRFNLTNTASSTLASGRTISIGAGGYTSGALELVRFSQVGATSQTLNTFSGNAMLIVGPGTSFDGSVNFVAPRVSLRGGTFNGLAYIEKNGTADDSGNGNLTFNAAATLVNSGSGHLRTDGNNIFAGPTTLLNSGSNYLLLELTTGSTYNGALTLTNTGTSNIRMAFAGATTFNGDITVNSTDGTGVVFGETASSTSTLNGTIAIGGSGFSSGDLRIQRLTQNGGSPIALTAFTGTARLLVGPALVTSGAVDLRALQLFLNGITVGGTAHLEKTGAVNNLGSGNNVFASTTTIVNNGTGEFRTDGNNTFHGDVFITNNAASDILLELNNGSTYHGNVTLANNSTSNIRMAYDGVNTFNGNIIVNSTAGSGIQFCENSGGTATLAAGNTITVGGLGFTTGNLTLRRVTQLGSQPITIALTGSALLQVGPATTFGGNIDFLAPRLLLNGMTAGGTATLEKTGALDDSGTGGNIFHGVTTITNSGSGHLLTGANTADQFNAATTFNNTGSSRIFFAHNHGGQTTTFGSDLTINSNKSAGGDDWSFFIGEGANTGLSVAGNFTINCGGSLQSNHRTLLGAGSTALYQGLVTVNLTNTAAGTFILMGDNGTSTYAGNIHVINSGGAAGITFNNQTTASSTLNGVITAGTYSTGTLNLYRFTQVGALPENITLTGNTLLRIGPNSSFDGDVTFISPRLLLNGGTYHGNTYLEKNGANDDSGAGGNIFNGTTTLTNSGSGYFMIGNVQPDIFNGAATLTNTGSNWIRIGYNSSGNQFNNNLTVNNTGSALGISFSNIATANTTLTSGTLAIGGTGFTVGDLSLFRFTQVGTIAQTLNLTGSARLTVGPSSSFDGAVNFASPRLLLNGGVYNNIAYLEKTGSITDTGDGGNIFQQDATLVNSGSGILTTARLSPDIFNSNLIVTNAGSAVIQLADGSAGNQFNGNIALNSTFGGGIYFCNNNTAATATLASGGALAVGSSGVLSGDIRLLRFTQLGTTPQSLNLSGIAQLILGPASIFHGNVDFRAPQLLLDGTTYHGTAYLEKKGAGNNNGDGGNVFNGVTTLVHSGSNNLLTGDPLPDIFNAPLTVTNTGSGIIYLAHNSAGNQFNANITFNSTLGSGGIYFSNNGALATSILANGATLSVGGLGFSSGSLWLRQFTQLGTTPQALTLTGTARMMAGPSSVFHGNVDFRAPRLLLETTTYQGTAYFEKTGAGDDTSAGGNTFNGITTVANSGSNQFRFGNTALDTFNGDVILTNTGASSLQMSYAIAGTVFNGNISVNSTFGGGVYFGLNGGTTTLAAGRTLSVGGTGFTLGNLDIRNFTQTGATPQNLLLTGTSALYIGPNATLNGNADFRAPNLYLNTSTFNGTAYLEKTGASNNNSVGAMNFQSTTTIRNSSTGSLSTNGNNIFNGSTTLINSGSNFLLLELSSGSTYNGDLTLINMGSSSVRSAYAGTTSYNGNILVNSTSGGGVLFGELATANATLANGRTVSVGGTGFTAGTLLIQRFTQTGSTAQNLALTGASILSAGPSNVWNGNITASAPAILLNGNTFNGGTNMLTKTGSTTDQSVGGNTFGTGTTTTIFNIGTGIFRLANTIADDFAGHVVFNQTSGTIQPAYNLASTFRGNVTVTGTAAITFGSNNGGITFAGNSAQTVNKTGGSPSPIFRRMVMNKSGNATTLNTDVTVTTDATFTSGVLNTSATNYLNFADNATATGGSNASHIDGPVRKTGNDAFTFPTGDNGIYRSIGISAPTVVTHFFTAEYFKAAQGFGGPTTYASSILTLSPCEYWMLDRNPAMGGSNVSVTLSWVNSECVATYITDPSTLAVARWNGTNWVNHGNGGTTGTAASGTVVSGGVISSFSPITIASTNLANPLPIELVDLAGEYVNGHVNLQWLTASEVNNAYFTVEQSADGFEFTSIGRVNGQGTVSTTTIYNFRDLNPYAEKTYYRLRQTDFDGTFTYSDVISVDSKTLEWNMYPNPVSHGTEVTLTQKGNYVVYSSIGNIVMTIANANKININTLPAGMYIIRNAIGLSKRLVIR